MSLPRVAGSGSASNWVTGCQHLQSVAVAVIHEDGTLIDGNQGFLRLLALRPQTATNNVADVFASPVFNQLASTLAEPGQPVHRGIINLGSDGANCRSLVGAIYRDGPTLLLAAEFDIAELEMLQTQVLALNAQLADSQRNLARQQRTLRDLTLTDPLTGLANRRRLDEFLDAEQQRLRRHPGAMTVIMADIDHFKRVNDVHGHATGDAVLRQFAQLLRDSVRKVDLVARLGGEEFIVVLSMTDLGGAMACAEMLRERTAAQEFQALNSTLSASFGVAQLSAGEDTDQLIARADAALYRAKSGGRNRVETESPQPPAGD